METLKPTPPIGAIVLAAGLSRRMGELKPLLPFGDKPMLARVLNNMYASRCIETVVVVTGHEASQIIGAAGQSDVPPASLLFAHNPAYADGEMLTSIRVGLRSLPVSSQAFLLVLGDQAGVGPGTVRSLRDVWVREEAPIVLPTRHGRRGHPLLFSAACRTEILALPTGATLRDFVRSRREVTVEIEVGDEGVLIDVDTPEDYQRALRNWQDSQG